MSCCKGHTYKCHRCREKFCERCQRGDEYKGDDYCYSCYYIVKGQDASNDESRTAELEREVENLRDQLDDSLRDGASYRLKKILELLEAKPPQIDRDELVRELKEKFDD